MSAPSLSSNVAEAPVALAAHTGLVSGPGFWLAVAGVALGSFALRAVFIYAMERIPLTENVKIMLRYIPASVLAALVAPAIVLHQGQLVFPIDWLSGRERLLAGLVAAGVALWKRSMILTIVAGMGALYLLRAVLHP